MKIVNNENFESFKNTDNSIKLIKDSFYNSSTAPSSISSARYSGFSFNSDDSSNLKLEKKSFSRKDENSE